jgi:hypothetical protein
MVESVAIISSMCCQKFLKHSICYVTQCVKVNESLVICEIVSNHECTYWPLITFAAIL